MALRFRGIDPDTPGGGSPSVWLEDDKAEIVIQNWLPDMEMYRVIGRSSLLRAAVAFRPATRA